MLEIEKKKIKHQIHFRSYSSRLGRTQYNQNSQGWSSRENVYEEIRYHELARDLEILVPYLNNSSEETIFGSNKIKEQHETMKLQNEVSSLKTLFINELEQTSLQQTVHKWEKLRHSWVNLLKNENLWQKSFPGKCWIRF